MTPVFAMLCAVLRRFSLGEKSFTVAALGHIGPGDATFGSNFPLGPGRISVQPVSLYDDCPLAFAKTLCHTSPHLLLRIPIVQLFQHIIIHTEHIH